LTARGGGRDLLARGVELLRQLQDAALLGRQSHSQRLCFRLASSQLLDGHAPLSDFGGQRRHRFISFDAGRSDGWGRGARHAIVHESSVAGIAGGHARGSDGSDGEE